MQAIQLSLDVTFEPASVRPPPQRKDPFAVYQAVEAAGPDEEIDDEEADDLQALLSRNGLDSDSDEE